MELDILFQFLGKKCFHVMDNSRKVLCFADEMKMIKHENKGVYLEVFMLLAVHKTFFQHFKSIVAIKEIVPIFNGESNKIYLVPFSSMYSYGWHLDWLDFVESKFTCRLHLSGADCKSAPAGRRANYQLVQFCGLTYLFIANLC
jgi:hypothetical protein